LLQVLLLMRCCCLVLLLSQCSCKLLLLQQVTAELEQHKVVCATESAILQDSLQLPKAVSRWQLGG
jgi:hypothetical protein